MRQSNVPVTFWFEFASTYSYLSVMRIDAEAGKRGVQVIWKPFLLGPMFKAHGWNTSPFVVYPKKGRNMWRDVERRAKKYGLAFSRPDPSDPRDFPAHSVLAARIALVGLDESWGKQFCRDVYVAQFANGEDVSDPVMLTRLAKGAGAEGDIIARATTPDNKLRLRTQTEDAFAANIYGAPSFTVGEELFWGDDRLEDALDWALR